MHHLNHYETQLIGFVMVVGLLRTLSMDKAVKRENAACVANIASRRLRAF